MRRFGRVGLLLAFLAAAGPAVGQQRGSASGTAAGDLLGQLADSARLLGLPAEPLLAKAAEGALKGATDARILQAVRTLLHELRDARSALPPGVSTGTLVAAASAIHAGVAPEGIRRVASEPGASDGALGVAFVTLADLVASQVPAGVATTAIVELVGRRAGEAEMTALRLGVARDVHAGLAPEAAMSARARGLIQSLERRRGGPGPPPTGGRP